MPSNFAILRWHLNGIPAHGRALALPFHYSYSFLEIEKPFLLNSIYLVSKVQRFDQHGFNLVDVDFSHFIELIGLLLKFLLLLQEHLLDSSFDSFDPFIIFLEHTSDSVHEGVLHSIEDSSQRAIELVL